MKKLVALTSVVFAASALSTAALANEVNDDLRAAQAGYKSLSAQLETMGYEAQAVSFDGPMTASQKLDVVNDQYSELQNVFNKLNAEN